MKRKDIGLILVIAIISAVLSIILSNILIVTPKNRQQKVEVVKPIMSDFQKLPGKYFNDKALDPTQLIRIGQDKNDKPFGSQ